MIDKPFLNNIIKEPYKISKLDFHYISQILRKAEEIFKEEKLLLEFNLDDSKSEVWVIGDIHGNLETLQRLIEIIDEKKPEFVIFLGKPKNLPPDFRGFSLHAYPVHNYAPKIIKKNLLQVTRKLIFMLL